MLVHPQKLIIDDWLGNFDPFEFRANEAVSPTEAVSAVAFSARRVILFGSAFRMRMRMKAILGSCWWKILLSSLRKVFSANGAVIWLVFCAARCLLADGALDPDWTLTRSPITYWDFISCSDDGAKFFAAAAGSLEGASVYVSTNSGAAWYPVFPRNIAVDEGFSAFASSGDATQIWVAYAKLSTTAREPKILRSSSTSGFSDWTEFDAPGDGCTALASSADGSRLYAATGIFGPGSIFLSIDGGASWNKPPSRRAAGEYFVCPRTACTSFRRPRRNYSNRKMAEPCGENGSPPFHLFQP